MKMYAELEIDVRFHWQDKYIVDFRFIQPSSETEDRPLRGEALVHFDLERLRILGPSDPAYGELLYASLFGDADVTVFDQVRSSVDTAAVPLRIRLFIHPSALELHSLSWETLRDPRTHAPLLTGERIVFSRYLSSSDWQPVRLLPKRDLHALAVVANPKNLEEYQLAAVKVAEEIARLRESLRDIFITELVSGQGGPVTLINLVAQVARGVDILYLVCHGRFKDGTPYLYLENEQGEVKPEAGDELARRIRELKQRPMLVVLASCQSAAAAEVAPSADEAASLASVGPLLAEAGAPAVLAMQGEISMPTLQQFMPVLFKELHEHGQIDLAVSVARGVVRDRDDAWMPVLFMRLRSGRIWYLPGFGDDKKFEKWPTLLRSIAKGRCTPILGPALIERFLGTSHEIAQSWADEYHFPMDRHDREDLTKVAQFLAINQSGDFLRDELRSHVRKELLARYGGYLPTDVHQAPLNDLLEAVGARLRTIDSKEPHTLLAQLPFPLYVSTNSDNLLATALHELGRKAEVVLCPWNEYAREAPSIYEKEPDFRPTPQRPLIYHLFGQIREPNSVVLTEDDYFKYLMSFVREKILVPPLVRRALTDQSLLFLGFQIDDWNFRVLFHSILSLEGGERRVQYPHVAVQIDLEESRIQDPERARKYLESYFGKSEITIYWGRAEDFLKELHARWQKLPPQEQQGLL